MFIRIRVFEEVDSNSVEHPQEPFDVDKKFRIIHHFRKDQPDEKYKFKTRLLTLNTNHIVSVLPIKYQHYDDTFGEEFDGSLIIDSNNHQYISPVSDLDKRLMELETQQFDFFTFDEK